MNKKKVLVIGNFDGLHPGHIRLLKFARDCGDYLMVAVNSDEMMEVESKVSQKHRLELILSLECVDEAFITNAKPEEITRAYKPYAIVKGREFESRHNPELSVLESYGGKLIFGSGEFETNADHYLKRQIKDTASFDYSTLRSYINRHNLTLAKLKKLLNSFSEVNVGVIGEIIVDEYIHGTATGLSQEDPTIVMIPETKNVFIGGAAITAGHLKSLGARHVKLYSVVGEDEKADYVKENIHSYGIQPHLYSDSSRPTPLKTRYRASNKTLLRVNQLRQHKITQEIQREILEQFKLDLKKIDILIFSDFNYGVLPQELVDKLLTLCQENDIYVVADSQSSSQVGDISRFKGTNLLTPTEREVRLALNNVDDGLVILANKLCQKASPENLVVTLGHNGVFIHSPSKDKTTWYNDSLPAINKNAIDPAGAGDCFLAASSLALYLSACPWSAFFIANIAAACQVSKLGNQPLSAEELQRSLCEVFQ